MVLDCGVERERAADKNKSVQLTRKLPDRPVRPECVMSGGRTCQEVFQEMFEALMSICFLGVVLKNLMPGFSYQLK